MQMLFCDKSLVLASDRHKTSTFWAAQKMRAWIAFSLSGRTLSITSKQRSPQNKVQVPCPQGRTSAPILRLFSSAYQVPTTLQPPGHLSPTQPPGQYVPTIPGKQHVSMSPEGVMLTMVCPLYTAFLITGLACFGNFMTISS